MADNSTRWQRVASPSGDKPAFQARQTTIDHRKQANAPLEERLRAHTRAGSRLTTLWWLLAVTVLAGLAAARAWKLSAA